MKHSPLLKGPAGLSNELIALRELDSKTLKGRWRTLYGVKHHLKFPPPYHLKLPPPVIPVLGVREGGAPPRHSAQKATTIMRAPALRTWA
jgi:hypothetical protein